MLKDFIIIMRRFINIRVVAKLGMIDVSPAAGGGKVLSRPVMQQVYCDDANFRCQS